MGDFGVADVLERSDAEIAWWSAGNSDRPAVVCVHGGAMDHRTWAAQVPVISERFRLITHDVRGHGASRCSGHDFSLDAAADDVLAIMDTAGVDSAVLVGHSFGATIAQLVALKCPDRALGLVGIGAACATLPKSLAARARQAVSPAALSILGQGRVRTMFADMAGVTPEVRAYALDAIGQVSDDVFAAVMRTGFGSTATAPSGDRLGVPLLAMQGASEPYGIFLGNVPAWIKRDDGQFVSIASAAHNAHQDAPNAANSALQGFLGQFA